MCFLVPVCEVVSWSRKYEEMKTKIEALNMLMLMYRYVALIALQKAEFVLAVVAVDTRLETRSLSINFF